MNNRGDRPLVLFNIEAGMAIMNNNKTSKRLMDVNRFGYVCRDWCVMDMYEMYVLVLEESITMKMIEKSELEMIVKDGLQGEVPEKLASDASNDDKLIGKRTENVPKTDIQELGETLSVLKFLELITSRGIASIDQLNFYKQCRQKGILLKTPSGREGLLQKFSEISGKVLSNIAPVTQTTSLQPDFIGYQPASDYSVDISKRSPRFNFFLFDQNKTCESLWSIDTSDHKSKSVKALVKIAVICCVGGFTCIHIKQTVDV